MLLDNRVFDDAWHYAVTRGLQRAIASLCFCVLLFAQQDAQASQPLYLKSSEAYQDRLDSLVAEHVPGAILFVREREQKFWGSAGLANIANATPMTKQSVIPNGSAGKKLIGLLVAMLHEEGKLDLDAPILPYLDDVLRKKIPHVEAMTLRRLLNHTSGIFEFNDVGNYAFFKAQFAPPYTPKTDRFMLEFVLDQPASFRPGERYGYSNTGYSLAGVILERLLGEHHSHAIRQKILSPLHMHSAYFKGIEPASPHLASGYFTNDEDPDFPTPMDQQVDTKAIISSVADSSGPLAANAKDMATLLRAIVSENSVVSAHVREHMIGDAHLVESWGARFYRASSLKYGLGVWREQIHGQTFYHHGGTEFGYYTQNIYIPAGDVSITALANCGVNDACEVAFADFTFEILEDVLQIRGTH